MFELSGFSDSAGLAARGLKGRKVLRAYRKRRRIWWLGACMVLAMILPSPAVILWSDPDLKLIHENGPGNDILAGAVKRDDSASDTLYFKFHVDPLSDKDTEEYFAGLQLFEGDTGRLGIGNALKAWAYSAFFHADDSARSNSLGGYIDLHSSRPESAVTEGTGSYELPRRGTPAAIVFKVQYIPGEDDLITVWLNPDLGPGANEAYQAESLTTRFNANASFDEIRLRHSGNGGGWNFSDLAIATSFSDFVDTSGSRPTGAASGLAGGGRAVGFQSWQKDQGLPENRVRAMLQTHDGYVWIGGDEGLARFDGIRFVSLDLQNGIKGGPVSALCEDRHGGLWIGSAASGLSIWQNNRMSTLTTREGLPGNSITALKEDTSGRIWIGTDEGLVSWQNSQVAAFEAAEAFKGLRINALFKEPQGSMWVAVKGAGVYRFENNQFAQVTADSLEDVLKDAHCILVDKAGRLWLGAGEEFVLCREGQRWHRYRIPRNEAKSYISALAEDADGTVWAGSAGGGLLEFSDGNAVAIPAGSGLAGNLILCLAADREGKVWVGTEAGLNRVRRKSLVTLSQAEGLGFGAAQGMAEVAPGIIWVGRANNGVYRWDGKSFSRLPAAGLSPRDSQITSLLTTHEGFCWLATTNSLLLYKDPVAAADEVIVVQSAKPGIISMAEARDGAIWIGTREGKLWRLEEDNCLPQPGFIQKNAITCIVPETDGSIWVGTDGDGVYRFVSGGLDHIEGSKGLLGKAIRALHVDAEGTLWIGTADAGLSRWRNGRVANFTTREGLPDNNVMQILEDDAGRLWLGTSGGIVCISKARLEELASGRIHTVYPQLFRRAEGMLSEECTGGFCPAGLKTKSGLLWFSTMKGVAVVNPRLQPVALPTPNTVLEEVVVDGAAIPQLDTVPQQNRKDSNPTSPRELVRITPGKHRVEFRYTGLSFDAPESIRFRYRLEGLDTDWVEAGTRRTAFYSYLPPGDYRFRVSACNSEGRWSENESEVRLVVSRHFWQTWWFAMLAGVAFLGSVVAAVHLTERRKLHRRLKRLEQEGALERERTRIAQDLHDEMGAKLCRISFLSEHARRGDLPPEELQLQIASISDASREVLHSLDEIVWAVNPRYDTLEHVGSYMGQYAQDYFQMTGIQCELDIPTQLPPHPISSHMRHHLFLATHEALTNILKHSGATRAGIAMTAGDAAFELRISDNGKGFSAPPVQANGESALPAPGDGLTNMRKRLSAMGGQCWIESAAGQGTIICFVIPLDYAANGAKQL
jgi:ligand-binding sensor domain-containing protein/signal transduction histidine kinase